MSTRLEKCAALFQEDRHQEIIDLLEAIPAEERTPERDSELARAYNNVGSREEKRNNFHVALDLLLPHARYFQGDHLWNFRVGFAYYWLDKPWVALPYFEEALKARPGDADTQRFIDSCKKQTVCPYMLPSFNERAQKAWDAFVAIEEKVRTMIDSMRQDSQERVDYETSMQLVHDALENVFDDINFELGFDQDRYDLVLSAHGFKRQLLVLLHFARLMPEQLKSTWKVTVGRRSAIEGFSMRAHGQEVSPKDVRVWMRVQDRGVGLQLYCEKLARLAKQEPEKVDWFLHILVDQVLGEVSNILLVQAFEVLDRPLQTKSISLAELPEQLKQRGLRVSNNVAQRMEQSYFGYEQKPDENWESDWRSDIFIGRSRARNLLAGYENQSRKAWEALANEGAFAGFIAFSLSWFDGENRGEKIMAFCQTLHRHLDKECGSDVYCHLGSANGIYACYVDFFAWDIHKILDSLVPFFDKAPVPWAIYHVLRRDGAPIVLKQYEEEEQRDPFAVDENAVVS